MDIRSFSPRHRVTIYRAANGFKGEDISPDVVEISTDRVYGRHAGAFTILATFNQRFGKRLDELLKTNDRALIELDEGAGKGFVKVMLGLVNDIGLTVVVDQEGRPLQRVLIMGWDFGKLLMHNCGYDIAPLKDNIGSEAAVMMSISGLQLVSGTPAALTNAILEYQLFRHLPWAKDYILADRLTTDDYWQLYDVGLSLRNGPVWAALKYVSNEPYNVLHCDTGDDGKFHIVLEKCPYNNVTGKLERPSFHVISESTDVVSAALRQTDQERINYIFYEVSVGTFGEASSGTPLLYIGGDAVRLDKESIAANGFLPWYPTTSFTPFSSTNQPTPPQLSNDGQLAEVRRPVNERTEAFWNWYRRNHEYESGSFTLRGMPAIRCGHGVLREKTNREYFIQQVNHRYVISGNVDFKTTVQVVRGQDHGK